MPLGSFYILSENITSSFLMFSGGIERDQYLEMDYNDFYLEVRLSVIRNFVIHILKLTSYFTPKIFILSGESLFRILQQESAKFLRGSPHYF